MAFDRGHSHTSRGPVCDQICRSSKTWLRLNWSQPSPRLVADPTSLQFCRDRSGTLSRPLWSVEIVGRGEVAKRYQRMCDWGFIGNIKKTTLDCWIIHMALLMDIEFNSWLILDFDLDGGIRTSQTHLLVASNTTVVLFALFVRIRWAIKGWSSVFGNRWCPVG